MTLPDYLWGIETESLQVLPGPIVSLPDYLWGIETRQNQDWMCRTLRLPDYLWGIETHWSLYCLQRIQHASRLPMRNWNFKMRWLTRYVCRLPDYLWGIETQKHRLASITTRLPDYLWGIETLRWDDWLGMFAASRLPMRNWNNLTSKVYSLSFLLPDYLWGIETSVSQVTENEATASRLPMRNWNLFLSHVLFLPFVALPDYLWGIETSLPCTLRQSRRRLPDYLWGIETPSSSNVKRCLSLASRLPMRNWNGKRRISYALLSSFQTTYEELKLVF